MTDRELLELLVARTGNMEKNIAELKSDVAELKSNVAAINTHLENVTDKNICIVAEGHLDLMREFDRVRKTETEKETLLVRMTFLEGEVAEIKRQLAEHKHTA